MNFPKVYLASGSPRRRELLTQMGVDFSVLSVEVDETYFDTETPRDYVQRVAIAKAKAGRQVLTGQQLAPVIGADTSVIVDNKVLGKPKDNSDSRAMLQLLSGRSHQVLTSVAVVTELEISCLISSSTVHFAELSDDDIAWYIATQEGHDKAGSYAVQGLAAMFIEQIQGSYSGIMGLPLRETSLLLKQLKG
ncbi:MAG: septum formation inhibitor Maf [Gammaproteobacteria bacterium]|nr:MAG: septum formation inhibitor Maf [Gammaproteobacteria bacterium]